jgi:type IV pilus assembly protein PilX
MRDHFSISRRYEKNSKKFRKSAGNMPISLRHIQRGAQQGMTLLVGMILLGMLTLIGLIGFRNTTMSERMTGNSVDRNISFQSAESAGKEALAVIERGAFNSTTLGHFNPALASGGNTEFWVNGAGSLLATPATQCSTQTTFSWSSCAISVGTKYASNAANAQYVIELISQISSGGSTVSQYRITTRSTGGSGKADVVLQNFYSRTTTP